MNTPTDTVVDGKVRDFLGIVTSGFDVLKRDPQLS